MSYTTLISTDELASRIGDADWAPIDCRFSLDDTERGRRDYAESHVAGAIYAHLDGDLSSPLIAGRTGRHPLPDPAAFAETLSQWGIDRNVQVVAYDDAAGAIAARLWWMLRWMGHDAVALLDGGWQKWVSEQRPVRGGIEQRSLRTFEPSVRPELTVTADETAERTANADWRVVDSRASERYRGENETIDPVAGHIPGALNAPNDLTVGPDGCFLKPEALRVHFDRMLGAVPADRTIFYCGSGVTAARNILAFANAGLGEARLFPGSWSEWIADGSRPIATGPQP